MEFMRHHERRIRATLEHFYWPGEKPALTFSMDLARLLFPLPSGLQWAAVASEPLCLFLRPSPHSSGAIHGCAKRRIAVWLAPQELGCVDFASQGVVQVDAAWLELVTQTAGGSSESEKQRAQLCA